MLLSCRKMMDGPGPSEVVIEVKVHDGTDEVVVHENALKNSAIEIGNVIGQRDGLSLVELPREAASGKWRIWVPSAEVKQMA